MLPAVQISAFSDELEKIAIASMRLRVAQSRAGRRPLRVSTLLKKEKEGTLYKNTKLAGDVHSLHYIEPPTPVGAVKAPRKKGDVPTRDDTQAIKREDGRENAHTVYSPSYFSLGHTGERAE